ncbi:MAG: hypothetical protein CMN86_20020 [Stappia sp.]|nr:hypothetical protein [Stappia sp.]|tara:strand:+ start:653 stop:1342 length:690 start_codon:yes stop_codon:yes gene_type:complete
MKLALLVCDHVAKPFDEVHGTYPIMFDRLLGMPANAYFVCDNQFPEIKDYDGFVVTGSKRSVYEKEEWISELIRLTREVAETNKKYVGLCFGHQVIGEALGGKVTKSNEGYLIGVHEHSITKPAPWMDPVSNDFNILMLCQDQISLLPEKTVVHASSPRCPHGMISIDNRILGIQGHPEFTREYNQDVFQSRIERIGRERVEEAIISMQKEVHTTLLSQWIKNFLNFTQ